MQSLSFQIDQALTAPAFVSRLHTPAQLAGDWMALLMPLFPFTNRLSSVAVIDAVSPMLSTLAPMPEEGWAQACFAQSKHLLFPENPLHLTPAQQDAALHGLQILQVLLTQEKTVVAFDPLVDFAFCTPQELEQSAIVQDYTAFLRHFQEEFIYELLRLGDELTPWRTLGHIAGVHHVAMTAARRLHAGGGSIDLALISAAAAGHDFGKYGCQPGESVPYLHYHYTFQWFLRHKLRQIGHIAANHSTWDLELENLSAESLSLVYADFRVKQYYKNGVEYVKVYSLTDAFNVILSKLDNVDAAKTRRYRFVYAKLMDFQHYLQAFGFDAQDAPPPALPQTSHVALMTPEETVAYFRHATVAHNLRLMHQMTHQQLFISTLESARGEKDWGKLRAYVAIFQEYHSYLTAEQKEQTLSFLYELLLCPDGDIRRRAAYLIGEILALFVSGYKKERPNNAPPSHEAARPFALWELYLDKLVQPEHMLTPRQTSFIRYQTKTVTQALLDNCEEGDFPHFVDCLLAQMQTVRQLLPDPAFALLDTVEGLPFARLEDKDIAPLIPFALYWVDNGDAAHQIAAFKLFEAVLPYLNDAQRHQVSICVDTLDATDVMPLLYLQVKLCGILGLSKPSLVALLSKRDAISTVFLDNLKAATHWIMKTAGVEFLLDQAQKQDEATTLHIATHLSNLLRVSQHVVVRHQAGQALLSIAPLLTPERRNEIAVELCKALESDQAETTQCIPIYFGQLALTLPERELDELLADLERLFPSQSTNAVCAAIATMGTMLAYLSTSPHCTAHRQQVLSGLLLKGLASQRKAVRQESLQVLGEGLFSDTGLPTADKAVIFPLLAKKILFLLSEHQDQDGGIFYSTSALRHLYRYVVQHTLDVGDFQFNIPSKVAFFPGTFDPFSLSHKGIVESIRAKGFAVYLAVDEFSWSKKTQPSLVRRQIVSLSVADLFDVYIFPHDLPVNLASPHDLHRLEQVFAPLPLYLAVGSDVICNASSYHLPPSDHSVHHLNHIVFRRDGVEETYPSVLGDVISLHLPPHLETISSTRIRKNIDLGRDISHLVDSAAQQYIQQGGFYLREPEYKHLVSPGNYRCEVWLHPTPEQWALLGNNAPAYGPTLSATVVHPLGQEHTILGYVITQHVSNADVFDGLRNMKQSAYVRSHTAGRICLVHQLSLTGNAQEEALEQWLLTETFHQALRQDCSYGVWVNPPNTPDLEDLLSRQGFVPCQNLPLLLVDLRSPIVVLQNLVTTLKEPFASSSRVQSAIAKSHRHMQRALTALCPGCLVLSLNAEVVHHLMEEKITQRNQVPATPVTPRVLGENMCVPFGKLLRGNAIPNTVTKTIHTSKAFSSDLKTFSIGQYAGYSPLESQVRTIKSFNRNVILVDDFLHTGHRMEAIGPLCKQEAITIDMVLVGLLSGQGRDLMQQNQQTVDSVYFVPTLQEWFVESTMYPFIGGDAVDGTVSFVSGLTPAINMIVPYAYPDAYKKFDKKAVFHFSKTCLENAHDLMLALEAEYRTLYARNLTLSHLGEAVILPLSPDKGNCLHYDSTMLASYCIENDLQLLERMERILE